MAALDAMTIRLHLRGMRVREVVEDLPERLVVAVVAISSVIRCSACGFKTNRDERASRRSTGRTNMCREQARTITNATPGAPGR